MNTDRLWQIALFIVVLVGLLALLARSQTTSISQPNLPEGTAVTVVTPAGEPNKVTTL